MKIITKKISYDELLAIPEEMHKKPRKQPAWVRPALKWISKIPLTDNHFTYEKIGMEKLGKNEPCIVLMNHSSFIDLEMVAYLMADREYHIVCTKDGFIGLGPILRYIGCISTRKFINDITLVKDMHYVLNDLKASVVLFPEASYCFDGTTTTLPDSLGKCIKMLKMPVVVIKTKGNFLQNPLYNELKRRRVSVSAEMKYMLSPEDISGMTLDEINQAIAESMSYDHFRDQQESGILVKEDFRANGLHRVLYKCPHCMKEGTTEGKGTKLICHNCKAEYELTEQGYLKALNTEGKFDHIPDWYKWQRECVKEELEQGTYQLDLDVNLYALKDTKCMYQIGSGHLHHDIEGFHLTGCQGRLDYYQKPRSSYSLYSDFYWYEIGDVICIGDEKIQYYCLPVHQENVAAKARLATEELYKMVKRRK